MNKNNNSLLIVLAVVIVGIVVWLNFVNKTGKIPEDQVSPEKSVESLEKGDDTTTAIDEDLEGIDISDLEDDFSEIDKDLEQL